MTKKCGTCKKEKPRKDFYKKGLTRAGSEMLSPSCKECTRQSPEYQERLRKQREVKNYKKKDAEPILKEYQAARLDLFNQLMISM